MIDAVVDSREAKKPPAIVFQLKLLCAVLDAFVL